MPFVPQSSTLADTDHQIAWVTVDPWAPPGGSAVPVL